MFRHSYLLLAAGIAAIVCGLVLLALGVNDVLEKKAVLAGMLMFIAVGPLCLVLGLVGTIFRPSTDKQKSNIKPKGRGNWRLRPLGWAAVVSISLLYLIGSKALGRDMEGTADVYDVVFFGVMTALSIVISRTRLRDRFYYTGEEKYRKPVADGNQDT